MEADRRVYQDDEAPIQREFTCIINDNGFIDNITFDCSTAAPPRMMRQAYSEIADIARRRYDLAATGGTVIGRTRKISGARRLQIEWAWWTKGI